MAKARTLVGLDVHATSVVAAVLDAESGELRTLRMNGDAGEAAAFCAGLLRPVRVAYEARPIVGMLSCWSGCCWRASCTRSGCLGPRRGRCVIWSAPGRRCAWI